MGGKTFEAKWGISCNAIAEMEGVSPEAIRMRVIKWGTPWQRRGKQTKFEKKYGRTLIQLAHDLGIHPITVARREYLYGDVYYVAKGKKGGTIGGYNKGKILNDRGEHWSEDPQWGSRRGRSTYMDEYNEDDKEKR